MKTSRFLNYLILILLSSLICGCATTDKPKTTQSIDPIVSADWLKTHINDSNLVILDTTVIIKMDDKGGFSQRSGMDEYIQGHIPNAGFADLLGDLSADNELEFIMPSPQKFKQAMENLGVGDNSRVVLYSANNAAWSARLWWMLKWVGFDNVAILDGGLQAWQAQGYQLSTEIPEVTKKTITMRLRPEMIASKKDVHHAIKNKQIDILDAMPGPHYLGQFSMYSRPGHILSARSMPTSELIEESGHFKPLDDMDLIIDGNKENQNITYCGGGVAASLLAYNLYRLGYKDVAVYMGSLQEWAVDPNNPMTTVETTE